jgi:hypothetical protein
VSEDVDEEDLIEALAAYDRRLRQNPNRWAWWQVALLFFVGALALVTQDNWWCAIFAACLGALCAQQPTALREAALDGYAAGWRRRRDGGRL